MINKWEIIYLKWDFNQTRHSTNCHLFMWPSQRSHLLNVFCIYTVLSGRRYRWLGDQGGAGRDQRRQAATSASEGHGCRGWGQPWGQSQGELIVQLCHCVCHCLSHQPDLRASVGAIDLSTCICSCQSLAGFLCCFVKKWRVQIKQTLVTPHVLYIKRGLIGRWEQLSFLKLRLSCGSLNLMCCCTTVISLIWQTLTVVCMSFISPLCFPIMSQRQTPLFGSNVCLFFTKASKSYSAKFVICL